MTNIFIGLKKTCLGVLERGDRDKHNERGLKEGRGIEMSTTVLPLRDARSLRLKYLRIERFFFIFFSVLNIFGFTVQDPFVAKRFLQLHRHSRKNDG